MPNAEKLRFSKIRHFLHTLWIDKPAPPKPTIYEQWCSNLMDQRGGITTTQYMPCWHKIQTHPLMLKLGNQNWNLKNCFSPSEAPTKRYFEHQTN